MGRAATHEVAQLVGQPVHTRDGEHDILMSLDKREHAPHSQQVRQHEVTHVQAVALQILPVFEQPTQQHRLLRRLNAERGLGRFQRDLTVRYRTDTADTAGDLLHLVPFPTAHHRFKKPRRFHYLPDALLYVTTFDVKHDIAVPFDAGQMVYIHVNIYTLHLPVTS
jgi:hypothetical protein